MDELVVHPKESASGTGTVGEIPEELQEQAELNLVEELVIEAQEEIALTERSGSWLLRGSEKSAVTPETGPVQDPRALLKSGLDFLSGLSLALSKPETTRQLVDSIVSQDPGDGKTYLKIPVESKETVENIIGLIGTFMQAMKG